MKVWISARQFRGAVESLMRRIQDERRIPRGAYAEADIFLEKNNWNPERGNPHASIILSSVGGNLVLKIRLLWRKFASGIESCGPPAAVGGEVELQIVTVPGLPDKKLGCVMFPKLRGEATLSRIGMGKCRCLPSCDEP